MPSTARASRSSATSPLARAKGHDVFVRLARDEAGATAIEYALIASILFLALATALPTVRGEVLQTFQDVVAGFQTKA